MSGRGPMTIKNDLNEQDDVRLYLGQEHRLRATCQREAVPKQERNYCRTKDREEYEGDGDRRYSIPYLSAAGKVARREQTRPTKERRDTDDRNGGKAGYRLTLEYPSDTREHRCQQDGAHPGDKSLLLHQLSLTVARI